MVFISATHPQGSGPQKEQQGLAEGNAEELQGSGQCRGCPGPGLAHWLRSRQSTLVTGARRQMFCLMLNAPLHAPMGNP